MKNIVREGQYVTPSSSFTPTHFPQKEIPALAQLIKNNQLTKHSVRQVEPWVIHYSQQNVCPLERDKAGHSGFICQQTSSFQSCKVIKIFF